MTNEEIELMARELEASQSYLHSRQIHPWYEYKTTTGPRKSWDDADKPPEGEGWQRNEYRSYGWERFDCHEESYWRRLKPKPQEP